MPYEEKDGDGVLFVNDRKQTDKSPDHRGTMRWNGRVYRISAWNKTTKVGTILSLRMDTVPIEADTSDDDIPF